MNVFNFDGRLTADPVLRNGPNGAFCTFTVANNEYYNNAQGQKVQRTNYIDVIANGKAAENHATYLRKGNMVAVTGRYTTSRWVDRGANRTQVRIQAMQVSYMSPRGETSGATQQETEDHVQTQDWSEVDMTPEDVPL